MSKLNSPSDQCLNTYLKISEQPKRGNSLLNTKIPPAPQRSGTSPEKNNQRIGKQIPVRSCSAKRAGTPVNNHEQNNYITQNYYHSQHGYSTKRSSNRYDSSSNQFSKFIHPLEKGTHLLIKNEKRTISPSLREIFKENPKLGKRLDEILQESSKIKINLRIPSNTSGLHPANFEILNQSQEDLFSRKNQTPLKKEQFDDLILKTPINLRKEFNLPANLIFESLKKKISDLKVEPIIEYRSPITMPSSRVGTPQANQQIISNGYINKTTFYERFRTKLQLNTADKKLRRPGINGSCPPHNMKNILQTPKSYRNDSSEIRFNPLSPKESQIGQIQPIYINSNVNPSLGRKGRQNKPTQISLASVENQRVLSTAEKLVAGFVNRAVKFEELRQSSLLLSPTKEIENNQIEQPSNNLKEEIQVHPPNESESVNSFVT